MLKILVKKWDENNHLLREALSTTEGLNDCEYKDLVKLTFDIIFNTNETEYDHLNVDCITEIGYGNYQGTLLYLIPFRKYYPAEYEYLMTYVDYGSCSGCDTLQAIQSWGDGLLSESQVNNFMTLCKDILTNTIKPYNCGWRNEEKFEQAEAEGK